MERMIRKIQHLNTVKPLRKKVAAYARVSSGKDAMLHSLSAQVTYYSRLIQSNPEWQYVGVYADEALTGTKDTREQFQKMLTNCRKGQIDMVITKSISRFARNTVTLLQTVREMKTLGVDVYFEEQNIHTMSSDGELMLTILASYAQEESLSASENQKWRVKRNFEEGRPWNGTVLGYRIENGQYIVVPEEAKIVKRIFAEYLDGYGLTTIAQHLNADGLTTRQGKPWQYSSLQKLIHNDAYTGSLLLQKTYSKDHISKQKMTNHGELPKYYAADSHESIIPAEQFQAVQQEAKARAEHFQASADKAHHAFTGKLQCQCCGKNYRRRTNHGRKAWLCGTLDAHGKSACPDSTQVPEDILETVAAQVLGLSAFDAAEFAQQIEKIQVGKNNALCFLFKDGRKIDAQWKDRSRAESWTPAMKEAARQKEMERQRRRTHA